MAARIYRPAKTSMQSGKAKSRHWVLEYDADAPRRKEPLMGYTSSRDMLAQVKLTFESQEEAVRYAKANGIDYRIVEPKETKRVAVSYSDNFKYDRRLPWTH
ncbi:MAG: ETC complex I subunit [Ahrensia sp.]|nr:ETC complex I subunit [Ahrensia sp.]